MTSNERRDSAKKKASDDSRDSSSWVHRFAATAGSNFDLAPSITSTTSSNAAIIAPVAGSLIVNIEQARAQPEIVPQKPADDGSCGPHVAARGLTVSLILHAAAQSAFAHEQATRSPSMKGQRHRRMLDKEALLVWTGQASLGDPISPFLDPGKEMGHKGAFGTRSSVMLA